MAVELFLCVRSGSSSEAFRLGDCPLAPDVPPAPLAQILALIGDDALLLDDATIEQILVAFDLPYGGADAVADPVDLWQFLRRHDGWDAWLSEGAPSGLSSEDPATTDLSSAGAPPPTLESPDAPPPPEPDEAREGEADAVEDAQPRRPSLWESAAGVSAWRSRRWHTPPSVDAAPPRKVPFLQRLIGKVRRRSGPAGL